MIVPQYWAEGRRATSPAGATSHRPPVRLVRRQPGSSPGRGRFAGRRGAAARPGRARLARREPKVPYNGAEGTPIREEIVSRHGESVVTRNSYGAHCLNTPNVLFADVDFAYTPSPRFTLAVTALLLVGAVAAGVIGESWKIGAALVVAALLLRGLVANGIGHVRVRLKGGAEKLARDRIEGFLAQHPQWSLRIYRTPAGLRVLAMHQTFEPGDTAVSDCFRASGPIRFTRGCV